MNAKAKIPPIEDLWEDRTVGAEEQFVEVAPNINAAVDAALDLHPISIRLQKNLIYNLKALSHLHGLGYQPLIRQILTRWVDSEVKVIIAKRVNEEVVKPAKPPKKASVQKTHDSPPPRKVA
jgi:hypothetical protein